MAEKVFPVAEEKRPDKAAGIIWRYLCFRLKISKLLSFKIKSHARRKGADMAGKGLYNFDGYEISSEELAEVFVCLKNMVAVFDASADENAASLVERQMIVSGYAARMKAAVSGFLKRVYQIQPEKTVKESYAGRIFEILDEIKRKTFYFREIALQLPADKIKTNLQEAASLAAGLPVMVAALDAGEDEGKLRGDNG